MKFFLNTSQKNMTLRDSRVVYFPTGAFEISILLLPHPRLTTPANYALIDSTLYELKEINGDNPHLSNNHLRPLTKKDTLPVRSLILENLNPGDDGLILENGNVIITTKFDLTYSLIGFFHRQKESSRFNSFEDLSDSIGKELPVDQLPESLLKASLNRISETVIENNELFYKYSESKTLQFLKSKVHKIATSFPESIFETLLKPSLYPLNIDEAIPEEMANLAKVQHSIYLLSSYLPLQWEQNLNKDYDLAKLQEYVSNIKRQKLEKKIAEEQIASLNQTSAGNKRNGNNGNNGVPAKKKQFVKKPTVKLSKGPLDSFFGGKKK